MKLNILLYSLKYVKTNLQIKNNEYHSFVFLTTFVTCTFTTAVPKQKVLMLKQRFN